MIQVRCECSAQREMAESKLADVIACPACGRTIHLVAAEQLPDGSGAADFDARLVIRAGPQQVGSTFLLGGVVDIEIGKLAGKHILLAGPRVSRSHCRLERMDFGPSRWKLVDVGSTNGVYVNAQRISERELTSGDIITIGDYELAYSCQPVDEPALAAPAQPAQVQNSGPLCPGCQKRLAAGAKVCTECGIYVQTGRRLLTAKGIDEDDIAIRADTWIRLVSWFLPFGLYPVASEAFGTRKPYTTWAITAITIVTSAIFLIVVMTSSDQGHSVANLMLWSGKTAPQNDRAEALRRLIRETPPAPARQPGRPGARPAAPPPAELTDEQIAEILEAADEEPQLRGEFHWYQLITHAFLHGGILHLAGNLLFLLVLGSRVNELIGNAQTAIVYLALAVAAALAQMLASASEPPQPMLGASGAIMGLAGMYFIFFPVHKVHMAIWFRGGMLTGWRVFYKLFSMRGFWLLVLWVGLNDVLPTVLAAASGKSGPADGTAHWAHLGGFMTGMALAVALLLARQANARGGDLLSVVLGPRAWALLGKPGEQPITL